VRFNHVARVIARVWLEIAVCGLKRSTAIIAVNVARKSFCQRTTTFDRRERLKTLALAFAAATLLMASCSTDYQPLESRAPVVRKADTALAKSWMAWTSGLPANRPGNIRCWASSTTKDCKPHSRCRDTITMSPPKLSKPEEMGQSKRTATAKLPPSSVIRPRPVPAQQARMARATLPSVTIPGRRARPVGPRRRNIIRPDSWW